MISEATNLFLCSLSPTSRQYLMAVAKSVELPLKTKLYNPDTTPPYAYFLNSGLASVVTPMANGQTTEVGFIGYEGIVGSLHLLGDAPIPSQGVMQLTGKGLEFRLQTCKTPFGIRKKSGAASSISLNATLP